MSIAATLIRQLSFALLLTAALTETVYGESADETFAAAVAHHESIIYGVVANRILSDMESSQFTDEEITEWLDAIVHRLAVCEMAALALYGKDFSDKVIVAIASGSSKNTVADLFQKAGPSLRECSMEYFDALEKCAESVNQEFGVHFDPYGG